MMRICLTHRDLHAITRGGIGTLYRELATRLRQHGHAVTLLTQQSPNPLRLPGVTVLTLPRTDDLDIHRRHVANALTAMRPDVVECSSWEAEALHYLQQQRPERTPVVVRGEVSVATMGATTLVEAERELLHTADAVTAVSDFAARDLTGTYGIPAPLVIPNGVDRDRFQPGPVSAPTSGYRITLDEHGTVRSRAPLAELTATGQLPPPWKAPDHRPRLIWVGKVTPMKGWDRLEQLVAQLHNNAHLTVLLGHSRAFCPLTLTGDGDVTIVQDLDQPDVPGFLRAADWLLSTSRWEGFGLAIAEALACGTPALLPADLGTAPDLLAEGGGLVYEDHEHLSAILDRPDRPLGRLASRFDWDRTAAATLDLYRHVASAVGAR